MANPLSPANPCTPLPATVVIIPADGDLADDVVAGLGEVEIALRVEGGGGGKHQRKRCGLGLRARARGQAGGNEDRRGKRHAAARNPAAGLTIETCGCAHWVGTALLPHSLLRSALRLAPAHYAILPRLARFRRALRVARGTTQLRPLRAADAR